MSDMNMNIIRNYLGLWQQVFNGIYLELSPNEIWALHNEWATCEAAPDEFPTLHNRYDARMLAAMWDKNMEIITFQSGRRHIDVPDRPKTD